MPTLPFHNPHLSGFRKQVHHRVVPTKRFSDGSLKSWQPCELYWIWSITRASYSKLRKPVTMLKVKCCCKYLRCVISASLAVLPWPGSQLWRRNGDKERREARKMAEEMRFSGSWGFFSSSAPPPPVTPSPGIQNRKLWPYYPQWSSKHHLSFQ